MTTIKRKQGDTWPAITATLKNKDGTAINLTGATVNFHGKRAGAAEIDAAATVTDAAGGTVSYTLLAADTDIAGEFEIEWEITFATGSTQRVPTDRNDILIVVPYVA